MPPKGDYVLKCMHVYRKQMGNQDGCEPLTCPATRPKEGKGEKVKTARDEGFIRIIILDIF